jgi:hypothetical protein
VKRVRLRDPDWLGTSSENEERAFAPCTRPSPRLTQPIQVTHPPAPGISFWHRCTRSYAVHGGESGTGHQPLYPTLSPGREALQPPVTNRSPARRPHRGACVRLQGRPSVLSMPHLAPASPRSAREKLGASAAQQSGCPVWTPAANVSRPASPRPDQDASQGCAARQPAQPHQGSLTKARRERVAASPDRQAHASRGALRLPVVFSWRPVASETSIPII